MYLGWLITVFLVHSFTASFLTLPAQSAGQVAKVEGSSNDEDVAVEVSSFYMSSMMSLILVITLGSHFLPIYFSTKVDLLTFLNSEFTFSLFLDSDFSQSLADF